MRIPVDLKRSYKLLNHGPTTLVTSAANGRTNVMAAAWAMPIDFEPPKVAVVIARDTFTRELVKSSGEFGLSVPVQAQIEQTYAAGSRSGRDGDKWAAAGLVPFEASQISAPLVEGCVAWLECKVLPEPAIEDRYDLFVAEVVAAWADDAVWKSVAFNFVADHHRTIHHVAGGHFYLTGAWMGPKRRG